MDDLKRFEALIAGLAEGKDIPSDDLTWVLDLIKRSQPPRQLAIWMSVSNPFGQVGSELSVGATSRAVRALHREVGDVFIGSISGNAASKADASKFEQDVASDPFNLTGLAMVRGKV